MADNKEEFQTPLENVMSQEQLAILRDALAKAKACIPQATGFRVVEKEGVLHLEGYYEYIRSGDVIDVVVAPDGRSVREFCLVY